MSKNLFTKKPESSGGDVQDAQQGRLTLKWGKIVEVAPNYSQARVEIKEKDQTVTYWFPILYPKTLFDKYYYCNDVDEPVWVLCDEQYEEGVILGAFYCPEAKPHEPHIDKTEIYWRDCSFVRYRKDLHRFDLDIRGNITVRGRNITIAACETLTLTAKKIEMEVPGPNDILGNGVPMAGLGAKDTAGHILITTGLAGGSSPECKEPCWSGPTQKLRSTLLRLLGYTPAGWRG